MVIRISAQSIAAALLGSDAAVESQAPLASR